MVRELEHLTYKERLELGMVSLQKRRIFSEMYN